MHNSTKLLSCYFGIYILLFSSCANNSPPESVKMLENGVIEINAIMAAKDTHVFPLSEIVTDVEFIKLESTVKSFFSHITSLSVTDQYILIACQIQDKVLLFDKEGKFLRQIGNRGRGPGEYLDPHFASLDPRERIIIVKDAYLGDLLKYDLEGNILKRINIKNLCPTSPNKQPVFIDDYHFALSFDRPLHQVDNHYNVAVFDLELNLVEQMIQIPNNDSLCLIGLSGQDIINGSGANYYWERCVDLLYTIELGKKPQPKYYINMDGTGQSLGFLTGSDMSKLGLEFNIVLSITDLPRYLLFALYNDNDGLSQIVFDKRTQEAFTIDARHGCFSSLVKGSEATLWENDIFGYPRIKTSFYFPLQNLIISPIYLERVSYTELECLKKINVLNPEKRDHLINLIENATGEELPLLVFMRARKN